MQENGRYAMKIIAHVRTDFPTKFGLPRQSGIVPNAKGRIVFEKEYRDINALRGLEDFSDLWVIWQFSETKMDTWSPTVRPPKLGGNTRMGVFATRSPFRPNPIGLSRVKIEKTIVTENEGPVIIISGIDMMDGTPVYDIKPYLPYVDSVVDAKGGFTENIDKTLLEVDFSEYTDSNSLSADEFEELISVLQQDPRPSYQNNPERIYGFEFVNHEVKFRCDGKKIYLISVELLKY